MNISLASLADSLLVWFAGDYLAATLLLCPTLPMNRSAADWPANSAGTAVFAA
jgi:hypothetical protein